MASCGEWVQLALRVTKACHFISPFTEGGETCGKDSLGIFIYSSKFRQPHRMCVTGGVAESPRTEQVRGLGADRILWGVCVEMVPVCLRLLSFLW